MEKYARLLEELTGFRPLHSPTMYKFQTGRSFLDCIIQFDLGPIPNTCSEVINPFNAREIYVLTDPSYPKSLAKGRKQLPRGLGKASGDYHTGSALAEYIFYEQTKVQWPKRFGWPINLEFSPLKKISPWYNKNRPLAAMVLDGDTIENMIKEEQRKRESIHKYFHGVISEKDLKDKIPPRVLRPAYVNEVMRSLGSGFSEVVGRAMATKKHGEKLSQYYFDTRLGYATRSLKKIRWGNSRSSGVKSFYSRHILGVGLLEDWLDETDSLQKTTNKLLSMNEQELREIDFRSE
jgi:hypothetical protein